MKKWIKNISDKEIEFILRHPHEWKKVPGKLDDKAQDMIRKLREKEERQPPLFSRHTIPAFAGIFTFIVFLAIFFINIKQIVPWFQQETDKEHVRPYMLYFTDTITRTRGNERKPLTLKDTLEQGDKIRTGDNSSCHIQLGDYSLVRLEGNTECAISRVQPEKTELELFIGKIFVHVEKLPHDSYMAIVIHDISITVMGTRFIVDRSSDGTTMVCVYQGTVQVEYPFKGKQKKEMMTQGKSISINGNTIVKETSCKTGKNDFQYFQIKSEKDRNSLAQVNFSITPGSTLLTIDNNDPIPVDKKAGFTLEPGKHGITVTKEGYTPYTFYVDLEQGEEYATEINLKQEKTEEKTPEKESSLKNWTWRTIYTYTNKDNSGYNNISGFTHNKDYAVAYTQTSIICINKKGMVVWDKTYGVHVNILFQSLPRLLDKRIFLSSLNNQILVLDSETGEELERIHTRSSIIYNYTMSRDQNLVYIPFSDGLYTCSLQENILDSKPLFLFNSPTIPVLTQNRIIVSSFLSKEVACFNKNGNHLWTFMRDRRGYSSPLIINENIFIGDKDGVVYSLSPEGVVQKRLTLQRGITSGLAGNNTSLLCLSDNGLLYNIRSDDLEVKASFLIDHTPDIPLYIFKAPLVKGNRALIGTEKGSIIIIDIEENTIEKELAVSSFPVSCTIHSFGDHYLIGTKSGEIILLENN
ncbi:MAG: FecR domain-containing protein [Spirochaetales bacterium]|nr:FecR domain-containing protein [Spirochaetales bacterium]